MQTKYVAGSIFAVLLTAMVLGSAAAGLQVSSNILASAGPKEYAAGAHVEEAPLAGNLNVTVMWCSDWTATYCVPIGGATVSVTNQAGATVGSALTNTQGQATFKVDAPAVYTVTADIENVSAFGYMAGAELQQVQTSAGSSTAALFQYINTPPQDS